MNIAFFTANVNVRVTEKDNNLGKEKKELHPRIRP